MFITWWDILKGDIVVTNLPSFCFRGLQVQCSCGCQWLVEVVVTRKSNTIRNFACTVLQCPVVLTSLKASLVSTTVSTLKQLQKTNQHLGCTRLSKFWWWWLLCCVAMAWRVTIFPADLNMLLSCCSGWRHRGHFVGGHSARLLSAVLAVQGEQPC